MQLTEKTKNENVSNLINGWKMEHRQPVINNIKDIKKVTRQVQTRLSNEKRKKKLLRIPVERV